MGNLRYFEYFYLITVISKFKIAFLPSLRNYVILTQFAHPIQRVLMHQILRPTRVIRVLDEICAHVKKCHSRSAGYTKVVV